MGQKTKVVIVSKGKKESHFVCVLLILMAITISSLSHAKTLKVCYDQWAPMTIFPTKEQPERGVVIDMLEHIYSSHGYSLEYYAVPLARGLSMVSAGLCDMLPEYVPSARVEESFEYATQATFAYTSAFVVRRDDPWRYAGKPSLKDKRIATGPGWDYSSMSVDYQTYIDDPNNADFVEIIAGNDDVVERVMHMIKENRVDLYADNELVLQYVLNRANLNDELMIVRPGLENKLIEFPIFSNKIPIQERKELIRIWNEGRLEMKGKQEDIFLKKYNVQFQEY
jgi:polar amino acid transport system substrate-binding protein